MEPALHDGDYIITYKPRTLRPGLIYVANHSDFGRIVKRLDALDTRGRAILSGDNKASTPSRIIGPVDTKRIIGRALLAITPTGLKRLTRKRRLRD